MDSPSVKFVHRANEDGTVDSICADCFVTVATCKFEHELKLAERLHTCDPWALMRFQNWKAEKAN